MIFFANSIFLQCQTARANGASVFRPGTRMSSHDRAHCASNSKGICDRGRRRESAHRLYYETGLPSCIVTSATHSRVVLEGPSARNRSQSRWRQMVSRHCQLGQRSRGSTTHVVCVTVLCVMMRDMSAALIAGMVCRTQID